MGRAEMHTGGLMRKPQGKSQQEDLNVCRWEGNIMVDIRE
jgi:hypothetical protein